MKIEAAEIGYPDRDAHLTGELFFDWEITHCRPGVLVVHGGAGLDDHTKEQAVRLAKLVRACMPKNSKRQKTKNGIRDVDVPEALAKVLRQYVAGKSPALCCLNRAKATRSNSGISTVIGSTRFLKRWG